jgi:H/ACA ribonucleoprotein complex subunit 4
MESLPFEGMKRTVLIRQESKTSDKFGKKPEDRTVEELLGSGIINIDKPAGPTSHQVSAYVKQILGIGKAGHSGTLDPKVTGCLPVALGSGTRIVQSLLNAGKEYICLMHLHHEVTEKQLAKVIKQFTGRIKQFPPVKSAVKRRWRYRKIYYIKLLDVKGQDILFKVGCEAGTYIRKLVHDMGQALGTGAHMAELRRSKAGPFHEDDSKTLQDLTDQFHYYNNKKENHLKEIILPIENGVKHLAKIWVLDTAVWGLCNGQSLKVPGIAKVETDIQVDESVAVMTLKNELVMVGKVKMISKKMISEERGVAVKPEQVFMPDNTYPKFE